MVRRYRSGWWLERKYWDEGWTQREIAEECGVSARTIRTYMNEFGIPTREVAGENHPLYGESRDEEVRERISEALKGREVSEETRERIAAAQEGTKLPADVREKISESLRGISRSEETRQKMSESTSGERNPNWRGGYSRRYGSGWSIARDRVRERDEVCQQCEHDGSDDQLEVHHIIPVRLFRESPHVRLEDAHALENLVLLCGPCHRRADYGLLGLDPPSGLLSRLDDARK